MSAFTFIDPNSGDRIVVRGPDTLTRDQAQRIFDQQLTVGALINLQPGQSISAVTQAAGGLATAESQVLQTLAQDPVLAQQYPAARLVFRILSQQPVTSGITVADYAQQNRVPFSIEALTGPDLTAILAQIARFWNQPASLGTNQGLGTYALTVQQLERLGYVRAGTTDTYILPGQSSQVNVLKSPRVWTGLGNINSAQDLLNNSVQQQTIQLDLLADSYVQLESVGVRMDLLAPREQAGLVVCAGRDLAATLNWINGGVLPAPLDQQFPVLVRDCAYAVDLAENNLTQSVKDQIVAQNYTNTVSRTDVDSAATRIINNEKIGAISYGSPVSSPIVTATLAQIQEALDALSTSTDRVLQTEVTLNTVAGRQAQLQSLIARAQALENQAVSLRATAQALTPVDIESVTDIDSVLALLRALQSRLLSALTFVQRVARQLT